MTTSTSFVLLRARCWFNISACSLLLWSAGALPSPAQDRASGKRLEKPSALMALEESRKSILSGRVEWVVLPEGNADKSMRYVSRYARNGDAIFENRGDPEGWTMFDGRTEAGVTKFPQIYMTNRDGFWHSQETGLSCSWWKRDNTGNRAPVADRVKDVRGLGVYPTSYSLNGEVGLEGVWLRPQDEITAWEQNVLGDGTYEVVAQVDTGVTVVWLINANKGWEVERVTGYGAEHIWDAVTTLGQHAEVWFPDSTSYYKDGRLVETVAVERAELNAATDPIRFTPTEMGLEPGSSISQQNVTPPQRDDRLIWNGDAVTTDRQWREDLKTGRRSWGPIHQRTFATGFESPYETPEQRAQLKMERRAINIRIAMNRHQSLWERYVREFIARYQLNQDQSQKAYVILNGCERAAGDLLRAKHDEISKLLVEIEKAEADSKTEEVKRLRERMAELRKPVDRIFETQLKPRIEKLPTRAQRQAAATSQPAKQPSKP